jgi:DNA-binding beta-propeller fold protein YncE
MRRQHGIASLASLLLITGCAHVAATPGDAPAYVMIARHPLGAVGGWDYLADDPVRHHLFVSRGDRVEVMDTTSGALVATLQGTDGVHGTAIAPGLGRGFTSNGKADSVTEFDLQTLQRVRDIPLTGQRPDAILYDATSRHVFTFNARSTDASVIDPITGKEIARIPLDGKPEFGASDNRGHVFVNIEDKSELTEIDSGTLKVLHTWPLAGCEEPSGLAIDAAHLRLFSVCGNRVMAITDGHSGRRVATIPIDDGPDAAAFDAQLGLAFSSNGGAGTLTIVHEDDPDHFRVVQSLVTQNSARTMALDPATHRLYLSAAKFETQPAGAQGRPPMVPGSFTILEAEPSK